MTSIPSAISDLMSASAPEICVFVESAIHVENTIHYKSTKIEFDKKIELILI